MNLKYTSVQDYDKCLKERTELGGGGGGGGGWGRARGLATSQQSFVREGPLSPPRGETILV